MKVHVLKGAMVLDNSINSRILRSGKSVYRELYTGKVPYDGKFADRPDLRIVPEPLITATRKGARPNCRLEELERTQANAHSRRPSA